MRKLLIVLAIGLAFALFGCNKIEAGDLYRIFNADSLVTAQIAGSRLVGYIATDDLSEYLGKQGQSNWQRVQDDEP
jgi:hypothetical protein